MKFYPPKKTKPRPTLNTILPHWKLQLLFFIVLSYPLEEINGTKLTNYGRYAKGTIKSGLSADQPFFTLNNVNITIISGSIHYFRVPRPYWRDRLKKLRAAGFNTVSTYVPWNLHEPSPGHFDFGRGTFDFGGVVYDSRNAPSDSRNAPSDSKNATSDSNNNPCDMSDFLDLHHFLELVRQEDLFAIVRPGPYICSELDFGGLPSWLLRDKQMIVRSSQANFLEPVRAYFNVLIAILGKLQFTRGGPIIALQIENELASLHKPDKEYMMELKEFVVNNGIVELLLTSDSVNREGRPRLSMEVFTGSFDHWGGKHETMERGKIVGALEQLFKDSISFNLYMFHGGTTWGFLSGANYKSSDGDFQPVTTSYDYDAPLDEAGGYTNKYYSIRKVIKKYHPSSSKSYLPLSTLRKKFPSVQVKQQLTLREMLEQVQERFVSTQPVSMELLPLGETGQCFGYVVYRKRNFYIPANAILKIPRRVSDTVMVLIDDLLVSKVLEKISDLNGFGYWKFKNSKLHLGTDDMKNVTLDLVVENWGRAQYDYFDESNGVKQGQNQGQNQEQNQGQNQGRNQGQPQGQYQGQYQGKYLWQYKGIWQGGIFMNNKEIKNWEIIPLEFKTAWNRNLSNWHQPDINPHFPIPSLYKFQLQISTPVDTFINMKNWTKGIVIVNGFVLGRYCFFGPQQSLYFPAPLQKEGVNEILVFEHFEPSDMLRFSEFPIFRSVKVKPTVNLPVRLGDLIKRQSGLSKTSIRLFFSFNVLIAMLLLYLILSRCFTFCNRKVKSAIKYRN